MIAAQTGVFVDGARSLVLDGEIATRSVVHAALDGQILEVVVATADLEHIAVANAVVLAGSSVCTGEGCVFVDAVGDDDTVAAFTDERQVLGVDECDTLGNLITLGLGH